jgi:calcium permeable stress-gated cation channel
LNNSYGPLLHALPLTLADKMYVAPSIPANPDGKTQDEDPEQHHELPQKSAPITEDEYGFANPAVAYPQRTVWIPEDVHGFSREAERSGRADGIDMVAGEGAVINDKGKVDVSEEPGVPGQVDQ